MTIDKMPTHYLAEIMLSNLAGKQYTTAGYLEFLSKSSSYNANLVPGGENHDEYLRSYDSLGNMIIEVARISKANGNIECCLAFDIISSVINFSTDSNFYLINKLLLTMADKEIKDAQLDQDTVDAIIIGFREIGPLAWTWVKTIEKFSGQKFDANKFAHLTAAMSGIIINYIANHKVKKYCPKFVYIILGLVSFFTFSFYYIADAKKIIDTAIEHGLMTDRIPLFNISSTERLLSAFSLDCTNNKWAC